MEKDPTGTMKHKQNDQRQTWTIRTSSYSVSAFSSLQELFAAKLEQFEYEVKVAEIEPFRALVQYLYSGDSETLWTRPRGRN